MEHSVWWEPDPKHPEGGQWFIGGQGYVDATEDAEIRKLAKGLLKKRAEEFVARSIFEWVMAEKGS